MIRYKYKVSCAGTMETSGDGWMTHDHESDLRRFTFDRKRNQRDPAQVHFVFHRTEACAEGRGLRWKEQITT